MDSPFDQPQPRGNLVLASAFTLVFLVVIWLLFVGWLGEASATFARAGAVDTLPPLPLYLLSASIWLTRNWFWALPLLGCALVYLAALLEQNGRRQLFYLLLTLATAGLALLVGFSMYAPVNLVQ